MKAAYITKQGPPDVIQYGEIETPKPRDQEVLVRITDVSLNHIDTYVRSGQYSISTPYPFILGKDFCGIVESVGKNVTGFSKGMPVWGTSLKGEASQGTFAEYIAVDQAFVYPLPQGVDSKKACAVIFAGLTACHGLIRFAKLRMGDTIFIKGASGAIGSALIELASACGATVIAATSSPEKSKWCREIGAHAAIDYATDDVFQSVNHHAPDGVNIYWDTSRTPNLEAAVSLLANRGKIILMSGYFAHPTLPVGPFYSKECSMHGFTLSLASPQDLKGYAEIINRCLIEGKLKAKIAHEFSLSDTAKAHHLLESSPDLWGKIILHP